MTSAEAGLVVGLITSTITVLSTTVKLYSGVKDADDIPAAFHQSAGTSLVIQDVLRTARARINTIGLNQSSCSDIIPVVDRCKNKALQLEILFRKVAPHAAISRYDRYRLAANALGKQSRVETLTEGILQDVKLLAEHPVVNAETGAEMGKLVEAIKDLQELPPSLSEDTLGSSMNNYGSGTMNANTGSGTANNNTSSGRQYIGHTLNFGTRDERL